MDEHSEFIEKFTPPDSSVDQSDASEQLSFDQLPLIDALREAESVKFGEFELSHGGKSNYYIDKYLFETNPSCLRVIGEEIARHLDSIDEDDKKLAGVALGAVPLVAIASIKVRNPYLIVRKEQKDYGTAKQIEGHYSDGEEVVVIEDVTTTGQSALNAVSVLRQAGLEVNRVVVVVDRQEGAEDQLNKHNVELEPLLTADALLKFGKINEKIGSKAGAD